MQMHIVDFENKTVYLIKPILPEWSFLSSSDRKDET